MKKLLYLLLGVILTGAFACNTAEGDQATRPSFLQKKDSISNVGMGDTKRMQNRN